MCKKAITQWPNKLLIAACFGGILTLPSAHAQVLGFDQFLTGATPANGEYSVGGIASQSPTLTGFTGTWGVPGGSGNIQATSLSYAAVGYGGPAGGSVAVGDWNRIGRLLDSSLTSALSSSASGTVYLSFLMQSTGAGNGYQSLELYGGGFNDGTDRAFQLGMGGWGDFNGGQFGIKANNGSLSNLGGVNTSVNLFLVKFDLSSALNGDSVTAWMNPNLSGGPGDPTGGVVISGIELRGIDRLSLATFGGGSDLNADELRFGRTLTDVVAVPEPTALALLGVGAIGLMAARRNRA